MSPKNFFLITGIIFLAIAMLHLLRLMLSWDAMIGGWSVPLWLSVAALVIAGYLGWQGMRLSKR